MPETQTQTEADKKAAAAAKRKQAADKKKAEKAAAEAAQPRGAAAKLGAIQHEVGDVEKTGQVTFGSTSYAHMQEHGLIQVLRPLWAKYNVTVLFDVVGHTREGNHLFTDNLISLIDNDQPHFIEVSGEQVPNPDRVISSRYPNEATDSSDKATNKALTNGMKYALQKFFLVPTEKIDDVEGSDAAHNVESTAEAGGAKPKSEPKPNGAKAKKLKALMQKASDAIENDRLDGNKVVAKLQSSFGVDKLADATLPQLREFESWLDEQLA